MYELALIGPTAPDILTLGTRTMRRGDVTPVSYLTSDMLEARSKGWLIITPDPPVYVLDARILDDQSQGSNLGSVIPPINTLADAAAAIATLADNHNRMVRDLSKMSVMLANNQSNLEKVNSVIDRHVKQ